MLIEIYADPVCPWCYIGKARLDRALADRPRLPVDIRWMPFQLDQDMPAQGMDRAQYLVAKFMGAERARQAAAAVQQTAERDGLPLRLDLIRRTPNTLDAHRLIRFADRSGLAAVMLDALLRAYLVEGRDIGDRDVLAQVAGAVGLDQRDAAAFVDSGAEAGAVRAADTRARQLGVHAVPCFIFNRRFAMAGAQEAAAFLPLLDLAEEELGVSV